MTNDDLHIEFHQATSNDLAPAIRKGEWAYVAVGEVPEPGGLCSVVMADGRQLLTTFDANTIVACQNGTVLYGAVLYVSRDKKIPPGSIVTPDGMDGVVQ